MNPILIRQNERDVTPQEAATTFLFVPATRLDRIEKALVAGADLVIVDLEDAVRPEDKALARAGLATFHSSANLCVRINDASTDAYVDDVALIARSPWVNSVLLPKLESCASVEHLRAQIGSDIAILGLVESARGIQELEQITSSSVSRLFFGNVDYTNNLATEPSEELFLFPRSRLVVASAAAGLAAPVDGPCIDIHDVGHLENEARVACALGMGGKMCIHPSQLAIVKSVFSASDQDVRWAQAVVDGFEKSTTGVFVLDGQMIDAPVVARAKGILKL